MKQVALAAFALILCAPAVAQQGPGAGQMPSPKEVITNADTDKSGDISLAEWTTAGRREQGFQFMDADANGKLTEAELTEGFKRMREMRGNQR